MEEFCGGDFWDLTVSWNTTNPDFTPCFQNTVLILIPAACLWLFGVVDLYFSSQRPQSVVPWSPLNLTKIGLTLVLATVDFLMLLYARGVFGHAVDPYPVNIYAPAVKIATFILFLALLLYSKQKGVQSSGVQSMYSLILVICEAVRFRSFMMRVTTLHETEQDILFSYILEVIYFPVVGGFFLLHLFPDMGPMNTAHLYNFKEKPCPELTSSFFSQLLWHWFTPMAWKGFRRPLEYGELWDLNPLDKSKVVTPQFDANYPLELNRVFMSSSSSASGQHTSNGAKNGSLQKSVKRSESFQDDMVVKFVEGKKSTTGGGKDAVYVSIAWPLIKTFGPYFFVGAAIKFISDLLGFVSPQILNLLISYVESEQQEPLWKGILYATILFCSAFLATLILAQATNHFYVAGMRVRTALVSAIYRKALLLSNAARRESTLGEIVNLMSVDVQRITELLQFASYLWSGPFIILLAVYFLWGILGPSSLGGLFVMLIMIPANAYIAGKIRKYQVIQMKNKDERVKLMNEVLSGIKVLKLYAWEPCFANEISKIRGVEVEVMKKTAVLNAVSNVLWTCAPFLVALITFGTYVFLSPDGDLDAHKIFVSLSLFNLMSISLTFLPMVIIQLVQAIVAVRRINRYMNAEEIDIDAVEHDENEADPILVENGTFSWDDLSDGNGASGPTLSGINVRVQDGQLVAVVGVVGCGKSSLLCSLLGEMRKLNGRVNTRGRVAYVAQQAWIQNAPLKDNILFGRPYDPIRYDRVIEACALKPDLAILPAGDETEIGEKGINLSGGQKQRVALARAAYSNADVFLLDDPLSAVDAHVGKHIFEKLLGPKGFLKRKTRVLVTHGVIYLPAMDNIFVLSHGGISESGTYQELMNTKGAFSEFLTQHNMGSSEEEEEGEGSIEQISQGPQHPTSESDEPSPRRRKVRKSVNRSSLEVSESSDAIYSSQDEAALRRRAGRSVLEESTKEEKEESSRRFSVASTSASIAVGMDKLIETERSETESVKPSVYIDYFKAATWKLSGATFVMYSFFQGFAVGANLWLSEWSTATEVVDGNSSATKNYYFGIYAVLGVIQTLAALGGAVAMAYGAVNASNTLHHKMLWRVLQAPMQFFDTTPIGRIVNRFAKDVDLLDVTLPLFMRMLLNGIFSVLAIIVVISLSTPIFIALIVPISIVYYFVQKFYVATSRQLKRLESVTRSPIYSHFGESIAGATTIRAYHQQERFILESEAKVDYNQISYYCSIAANRWLAVRLETTGSLVVLFAALFAVWGRDTISPGIVGLSISYALQVTGALLMLVRFTSDVETNIVAVERIKEYSEIVQEAPWERAGNKPDPSWPDKGEIVFNKYQTRYRPGLDLVLRNVTCEIKPGEKIGIVGRTGAGKSSLTLALFRIVEPAGGSIVIDGQDISRLGLHDLRGRITIIPQDPVLFSGTLRMNLDPFESYSDERIWHTLELAHLKTFVSSLASGLSHEVAEGGDNLSVGQRQLVCLARALLRKTRILVLDEATAAVDLDTDDLIQATIRKEFQDATVITIAHRLNTIIDSTRVMVLDKGEIKEFDTPRNLLKSPTSLFASMAKEAGISKIEMEDKS